MKKLTQLFLIAITAISFASCDTYPDGGLISKTETNLIETWSLDQYLCDGVDQTDNLKVSNFEETYLSSGVLLRSYIKKETGETKTDDGTWVLDSEHQEIDISSLSSIELTDGVGSISASDFIILKLDRNDLWYSFVSGSKTHELHFIKKK